MNNAAANADALIKEARRSHPSTRWLIYEKLARECGDGFANVVKRQVEEIERSHSTRTPRRNRKGGADGHRS
jgi:hypothetical protein